MKLLISDFFKRLSGISTPIGGISWEPSQDERQIVYRLVQKLGDRRLIHDFHHRFEYYAVIKSLEKMRDSITDALGTLSPESKSIKLIENIRKVLHLFQTLIESEYSVETNILRDKSFEPVPTHNTLEALFAMQKVIGTHLLLISQIYKFELDETLKHKFPIKGNPALRRKPEK